MQRFFLLLIPMLGVVSCSSSDTSEASAEPGPSGAKNWGTMTDSNNPFVFKKEDVESGADGVVTSGKRSRYDNKMSSAYAQANSGQAAYLQKDYQMKRWSGNKSYSTGSYNAGSYRDGNKQSRFGGKSSNEANMIASGSGQDFSTGSYRTGSAKEYGRNVPTGTNAYTEQRASDGWGRSPVILSEQDHRRLSMGQTRSLLGR
ncbi:MAG: hypothetical protein ACON38_09960 [Akkermansiaceae bacterium]